MSGLKQNTVMRPHRRLKDVSVKAITISKLNKKRMTGDMVKQIHDGYVKKNKDAKYTIHAFTDIGWIQLKSYKQDISVIKDEIDYLNGRAAEGVKMPIIYKTTFTIETMNK